MVLRYNVNLKSHSVMFICWMFAIESLCTNFPTFLISLLCGKQEFLRLVLPLSEPLILKKMIVLVQNVETHSI